MRTLLMALTLLTLQLAGCANLSEVAKFSHESSQIVGNVAWVSDYHNQLERKRLYQTKLSAAERSAQQQADNKLAQDLREIHARLEDYLASLAAQADPDLAKLLPPAMSNKSSISAHPSLGIDNSVVNAFLDLGNLVYGGVTHFARQQHLKERIRKGEPEVQKLIGSLKSAADAYSGSLSAERDDARKLFRLEQFGDLGPAKPALAAFGGVLLEEKERSLAAQQAEVLRHKLSIKQIALGHTVLYENLNRLQAKDVVSSLLRYRKRMHDIQRQLQQELARFKN